MSKFMDSYNTGEIEFEEIHQYITQWHDSDSKEDLRIFLGMSEHDYINWAMDCKVPARTQK